MNAEEARIAGELDEELVRRIDSALLSNVTTKNRKLAMIVGLTMMDESIAVPGLPDVYYAERVKEMVKKDF